VKASVPRPLRAVIFDVDGTLAETERDGHRQAFNLAFRDHGLPFHWDVAEYGRLLAVTGGRYRLAWYLAEQGLSDPAGAARVLHRTKTAHFAAWLRSGPLFPRPGVHELLTGLRDQGVPVAIATTGRREWVSILLKLSAGPVPPGRRRPGGRCRRGLPARGGRRDRRGDHLPGGGVGVPPGHAVPRCGGGPAGLPGDGPARRGGARRLRRRGNPGRALRRLHSAGRGRGAR
jgi:hypothetical protein